MSLTAALVLCVAIATRLDVVHSTDDLQATDLDEFDNNNPLKDAIEKVENSTDLFEEQRTYVFKANGEVVHNYVEDHRNIHKDQTEQLIRAFEERQKKIEAAKAAGFGDVSPDPHSDEEENYQLLREKVKKENGNDAYDPEEEASASGDTPTSSPEGDRVKRIMEKSDRSRWTKAIVPYKIDENVLGNQADYERAMGLMEQFSCFRFTPWNETINTQLGLGHPGHLRFVKSGGCWSYQGNVRWSDGQSISCCGGYTCVHELGHAVGVAHEHQSPQREGWIRVNPDNITPSGRGSYSMAGKNSYMYFQGYDLSSIMHYPTWGFSSGGPTMTFLFPELFLDENEFYMFYEMSKTHNCHEMSECDGFTTKCENDGYVTLVEGKCACRCPTGLDPETGCTTNLHISSAVKMPTGQYALPKPKTGCPDSSFQDGQVIHFGGDGNYESNPFSLMGGFSGNKADHHFCTRTVDDGPVGSPDDEFFGERSDWPHGAYCILRVGGQCPARFYPGFIQFGDSHQSGSESGEVPDGDYGNNTSIQYCCQFNGFQKVPMSLPVDKPLVLFPLGSNCQEVEGMVSRKESFTFQNSDEGNYTLVGGIGHRFDQHRNRLTVYYCHYTPTDLDCGGVIEIDPLNPEIEIIANSTGRTNLECTWLVKGPHTNGSLVLDFEEFEVKTDDRDKCVDSVEVRHARVGQRGLVYCGYDDRSSIRSIFDKMLIRFKTKGQSTSNFRALVKWVPNDEMCYDVLDKGVTYSGKVNYTRIFEPCLPWTAVTECPHHPFQEGDEFDNLEGNYCRNPDNSYRPWCYTDVDGCKRNYCDICHLESPFNRADDCDQRRKDGFCTKDVGKAVHSCACACSDLLPSTGPTQNYTAIECPSPAIPSDAVVVGQLKSKYKLGEEVIFKCYKSINTVAAKCLTNGEWSSVGYLCTGCPIGSYPANDTDSCYVLIDKQVIYAKAKEACAGINGSVVMPKTPWENVIVDTAAQGRTIWLGLTDLETEGTFVWEDGTTPTYTKWADGEPNNWGNYEHCTVMKSNGLWNDLYCDVNWATAASLCAIPKISPDGCLDMLTDNACTELLEARPTMCQDFPIFAEAMCTKTCGVCGADAVSCIVPATSGGLVMLTNETVLSVGGFVRYGCADDYYKNGGSEIQACQADGTLTGSPLVCRDLLGSVVKVGPPTIPKRTKPIPKIVAFTGDNELWRIKHKGLVVAWEFYSNSPIETAFQVWRVVETGTKYKLIGQNVLTTGNDMEQRYDVPRDERIAVEPGDLIGIWNSQEGGVHFKVCDKVQTPTWNMVSWGGRRSSSSSYSPGATYSFTTGDGCCEFAMRAEIAVVG